MNVPLLEAARLEGAVRQGFADPAAAGGSVPGDGFVYVLHLFPWLAEWTPVLRRLGVFPGDAACVAQRASSNNTDFLNELLASGSVSEAALCHALAKELGIGCLDHVDADRLAATDRQARMFLREGSWRMPFRMADQDGATSYVFAPDGLDLGHLRILVARYPRIGGRLRIVPSAALRKALLERVDDIHVQHATHELFDSYPDMSARIVLNGWQGAAAGALAVTLPSLFWRAPGEMWLALHAFCSLFFLSCVSLRFAALIDSRPPRRSVAGPAGEQPVYSVLVALYREAEVVSELVASLERIDWPKSKLDIKLVCEADDRETLRALRSLSLPRYMEVVEVPAFGPRTKPKALAFALHLSRGEFVALYDAEDHPHPRQLLEAWHKFRASPPDVACVQAPLEIVDSGTGMIPRMFAFEYAALFRGLLPWLAARRLFIPLGGTSNHFRRSVIDQTGNWDPFNVTEDADLGMRLARFGYRTEVIGCPTWEAAPDSFRTWLPQRTRWLKGWMQTWLVHMRSPRVLFRELGFGSFLVGQILFAGMVLSALAHPFFILSAIALTADLVLDRPVSGWKSALLAIDIVNVGCGYLAFLLLGWKVSNVREKLAFWKIAVFTPIYWMMMSLAAWRALWQLCRKPHLWEKTPHRPLGAMKPETSGRSAASIPSAVAALSR